MINLETVQGWWGLVTPNIFLSFYAAILRKKITQWQPWVWKEVEIQVANSHCGQVCVCILFFLSTSPEVPVADYKVRSNSNLNLNYKGGQQMYFLSLVDFLFVPIIYDLSKAWEIQVMDKKWAISPSHSDTS